MQGLRFSKKQRKLNLFVAVILIASQLFGGAGFGVLFPNQASAANQDVWWFEVTADQEGNQLLLRDRIPKNINWNFVNMMGHEYLGGDNPANLNFRDIVGNSVVRFNGQLPAPTSGDYEFFIETNTHSLNSVKQDEVRLWVDKQLLIDTVGDPVAGEAPAGDAPPARIELEAGQIYDIRIELITSSGVPQSNIVLRWQTPGAATKTHVIDLVTAPDDVSPPSTVTDATYGTVSSSSVELLWTAPGSDDIVLEGPGGTELRWGTVSSYEIRYSTDAMEDDVNAWWDQAQSLAHDLVPAKAGTTQRLIVENLSEETEYHFAIRAKDASDNESAISNIVTVSTLAPDRTPPAAIQDLAVSYDDHTKVVTVSWTAPGDDGNTGTATSYDLRYDMTPIVTEEDWNQANAVSGLPAPEPAGTPQSVDVQLEWEKTYYFVITATDKEGNESAFSNMVEFTTPSLPIGVFGKIPLDPSMVFNEWFPHVDRGQNRGSKAIADEQELAGDPLNGKGGIPQTGMFFGASSFNHSYHSIIIDLGEDYELDYIFPYYGGGYNTGEFRIFAGEPFHWEEIYVQNNLPGNRWHEIDLREADEENRVRTRYVRLLIDPVDTRRNIREIVLYGKRLGTGMDPEPPAPAPHVKPLMHEFIGINGFRDDPLDVLSVAGNIREYHNWSLEVGSHPNGEIDTDFPHPYPNNINYFNPSSCCDGEMYYDDYFKMLHDAGIMVFPAIQGTVGYLGAKFGDKPLYPVDPNTDSTDPASYRAHADHMYQFAARYGSTQVPDEYLKLAEGQPRVSGLGYIEYFENGNETNAFWATRSENTTPYELAAMLSADYDGHEGTIVNENGVSTYGVKNADPHAKLVMAGTAGHGMEFITGIHRWAKVNRTDGKFPADVLNVHFYANLAGDDQSASIIGISPEDFQLKERMREIADYRDRYLPDMEFWVSEFGYDTHPNSPQRAPAIGPYSAEEVQAQWLVRTYLILASAGVDKAQMYMIRDVRNAGGKFETSGLVTMKGEWNKKVSWYYVYTLKNRLRNLRFQDELDSGDPNVMIQTYENIDGETKAYVVWAPTSDGTVVRDYQLQLPAATTRADLVQLVDKSTVGEMTPLTIADDYTVTIDVSERPLFVMLDGAGDLEFPVWPVESRLIATDITETGLILEWEGLSADDVTAYQVLMDGQVIGTTDGATTSFSVTGLEAGTTYRFSVQASKISGVWGTDGPEAEFTTIDATAPSVPAGLISNIVSDTKVGLMWEASADNVAVTGYRIYANGELVMTVGAETTYAGVIGLAPSTAYTFYVTAIDVSGNESEPSDPVSVTTDARPSSGSGGSTPPAGSAGGGTSSDGGGQSEPVMIPVPAEPETADDGNIRYIVQVGDLQRAMAQARQTEAEAGALVIDAAMTDTDGTAEVSIPVEALLELWQDGGPSDHALRLIVQFGLVEYEVSLNDVVEHLNKEYSAGAKHGELRWSVSTSEATEPMLTEANRQGADILGGIHHLQMGELVFSGFDRMTGTMTMDMEMDPVRSTVVKWNPERGQFMFVPAVFTIAEGKTQVQFKLRGDGHYLIVDRLRRFTDIDDSWAKSDIEQLASKMILNGRDAEIYAPHDVINRAEFASLIMQASGLGDTYRGDAIFTDVSEEDWYYFAAGVMQQTGMMIGHDGQFHPLQNITREEAIVVIHRFMAFAGQQVTITESDMQVLGMFSDGQRISDWSREAIVALIKAGIVPSGFSNQVFAPQEAITREECASLLRKALQIMGYM